MCSQKPPRHISTPALGLHRRAAISLSGFAWAAVEPDRLRAGVYSPACQLKREYSDAFQRIDLKGAGCAKGAVVLGMTTNAVRARLHHACGVLKRALIKTRFRE